MKNIFILLLQCYFTFSTISADSNTTFTIHNSRSIEFRGDVDNLDFSQSFPDLEHITFYYPKSWSRNNPDRFAGREDDMGLSLNPNLKSMNVQFGPYGKILSLAYLPNLESLTIEGSFNSGGGLFNMNLSEHFPQLQNLTISNIFYSLNNQQLHFFDQFYYLKNLTIYYYAGIYNSQAYAARLQTNLQAILPNTQINIHFIEYFENLQY